jgi:hypothetical protein
MNDQGYGDFQSPEGGYGGSQKPGPSYAGRGAKSGKAGATQVVVEPFPSDAVPFLGPATEFDPTMRAALPGIVKGKVPAGKSAELNENAGAVVDLTDDTGGGMPPYFGLNDEEMLYPGSLVKIGAMYAAFELRSRVERQVRATMNAGTINIQKPGGWTNLVNKVIADIEAAWGPKLAADFPDKPKDGFPQLRTILGFRSDGDVIFSPGSVTDPDGGFDDWLSNMVIHSRKDAAGRVIRALGFPYINGVLAGAGFFERSSSSGIWLSGDFEGRDWQTNNRAGQKLTKRWARAQRRTQSNFTATAYSVAALLTALARGQLVDKQSSAKMLRLMDGGTVSFVKDALREAEPIRDFDEVLFKIGIGEPPLDGRRHDCAIVKRTLPSKKEIRYVVVGFSFKLERPPEALKRLFRNLDDVVAKRHA